METEEYSAPDLNKNPIYTGMAAGIGELIPIQQFINEPEKTIQRALLMRWHQKRPIPQSKPDYASIKQGLKDSKHWLNIKAAESNTPPQSWHFFEHRVVEQTQTIVGRTMSNIDNPNGQVINALYIQWRKIQGEKFGNHPLPINISSEDPPYHVPKEIHRRLHESGIEITTETDLSDAARKVVLSDVLREFGNKETPTKILARLEEMGVKMDNEIFTTFIQERNQKILANTPTSPAKIDPVDVVTDWLTEKAVQLRDYALGINQSDVSTPGVFGIVGEQAKTAVTGTLGDIRRMSLRNVIQRTSQKCRQILKKTGKLIRATGGAGVEFGKGLGTSIGVAAEQMPVALGLDRLAKKIGGTVTKVFEKQSQNEMGFRTQLARLITGKVSIPTPTFTSEHTTGREDWAETFLESAGKAIEWLRTHTSGFRPAQLRILLGLAALTDEPDRPIDRSTGPVASEVGAPLLSTEPNFRQEKPQIQPAEKAGVPPLSSQEFQFLANGGRSPSELKILSHQIQPPQKPVPQEPKIDKSEDTASYWTRAVKLEFPSLSDHEQFVLVGMILSNLKVPGYNPARGNGIRQMAIAAVLQVEETRIREEIRSIDYWINVAELESTKIILRAEKERYIAEGKASPLKLLQKKGLI